MTSKKEQTYHGRSSRKAAPPARPEQKKTAVTQIVIIVLLTVLVLILSLLVYLFFQPGRIQLWQEQLVPSGQEDSTSPQVKRLQPAQEQPLPITELPVPEEEESQEAAPLQETPQPELQTRNARLFYVKVNMEGQITLKSLIRPVQYASSPLTETVNSLLKGPSSDEINKGSLTLIPDGTRLLSARVEGNLAYLNFNEAFRFNSLGREGYTAQLKQIVYTATEFSNIDSVQIMIDGGIKEYLGGEGIFVGEPLSRESFQTPP